MSPSIDGDLLQKVENNEVSTTEDRNGSGRVGDLHHVTVAGAGPAGLMLAYVLLDVLSDDVC
jgi:NADPH-dependent 2,4-dienoyl-CoA reductase/sulfur reductase-like enzyme